MFINISSTYHIKNFLFISLTENKGIYDFCLKFGEVPGDLSAM